MKESRPAVWAIVGVLVGFGLPVLACIGLGLVFVTGLAAVGTQAPPSATLPVHVSGPLTGPAVGIIEVTGPIVSGKAPLWSASSLAASGDLIPLIQAAALDRDVQTILLLVNSPGGSVVPSDEIYHALQEVRIPVVVLMEDIAASGAYYLSMAADHIIANPNTLTGSIGVISQFPDASELLEKVGVQFTVIESGETKDFGSPYRPMTPEEVAYWRSLIDETYQEFVGIVAEGRGISEEEVLQIADGRVFSGRQALELGLIDALGYQEDAIAKAAELGGITGDVRVVRYRPYGSLATFFQESLRALHVGNPVEWLRELLGPSLEYRWTP